ncbi:hypothetical protein AKO1_006438, partial [Acrasis kona]
MVGNEKQKIGRGSYIKNVTLAKYRLRQNQKQLELLKDVRKIIRKEFERQARPPTQTPVPNDEDQIESSNQENLVTPNPVEEIPEGFSPLHDINTNEVPVDIAVTSSPNT